MVTEFLPRCRQNVLQRSGVRVEERYRYRLVSQFDKYQPKGEVYVLYLVSLRNCHCDPAAGYWKR